MSDLIAAVATGWVRAGIGILRLSGDGCIEAAEAVFRAKSGKPLRDLAPGRLTLGTLFDEQARPIDQCVAVVFRAPHSYTGEDAVEFQCHGSPAVLAAGLRALFANGFRQALAGEFTRRAFLSGQMDLTQAEAVIDLIDAETPDAAANAAGQVGGALRRKIEPLYDALCGICAHFHAVLDYPDEDIDPFQLENFRKTLEDVRQSLIALLSTCARGRRLSFWTGRTFRSIFDRGRRMCEGGLFRCVFEKRKAAVSSGRMRGAAPGFAGLAGAFPEKMRERARTGFRGGV